MVDYVIGEDVFVDLTGSASAVWVQGKRGAPNVCTIVTAGNDVTTVMGIASKSACEGLSIVRLPSTGNTLPAQCNGHPYSFQ